MTDWVDEFKKAGAVWLHDGDPAKPHALLTSGLHSDGFVNCTYITQRPVMLNRILHAEDGLAAKLPKERVDWVIGSAMGAVTFAHAVAERLETRAGYTEKEGEAMKVARFGIEPGQVVLVVEDVISTGGSTRKTINAIREATGNKAKILPEILCLVNRSGHDHLDEFKLNALIELTIHTWSAEECPLVKQGSPALRPKTHWKELTGQA